MNFEVHHVSDKLALLKVDAVSSSLLDEKEAKELAIELIHVA